VVKRKQDEQQIWDVVDKLDNSLGYIAPEDREMRRTKMFDAAFAAYRLASKPGSADRERLAEYIANAIALISSDVGADQNAEDVVRTLYTLVDAGEVPGDLNLHDTGILLDAIAEHLLDRAEAGQ
jgi:hypothetical protein